MLMHRLTVHKKICILTIDSRNWLKQAKQKFARETGIPTSKAGLERKIGKMVLSAIFGKKR